MFSSVNSLFRILVLFLWAFIGGYGNTDCPDGCICDGGTWTCNDSSMDTPPSGTCPDVWELIFVNTSFSSLTPDSFKGFTDMDFITIQSNPLKELDMRIFANHEGMNFIEISYNAIERIVPLDDGQELPQLFTLRLSGNKITSVPANFLNGLTKRGLKLDLSGNPLIIPGEGPFLVSRNLQILDLRGCDASGISSETFKSVNNLRELDLTNASVTDVSEKFTSLPELHILELDFNPIKEIKEGFLSENQALRWIDLSHSQLETIEVGAVSGKTKHDELIVVDTPYGCQCKFEDIMPYFKTVRDHCQERDEACPYNKT